MSRAAAVALSGLAAPMVLEVSPRPIPNLSASVSNSEPVRSSGVMPGTMFAGIQVISTAIGSSSPSRSRVKRTSFSHQGYVQPLFARVQPAQREVEDPVPGESPLLRMSALKDDSPSVFTLIGHLGD